VIGADALEARNVAACENAVTPPEQCECRCGGAAHGKARGVSLSELPQEDPHHRSEQLSLLADAGDE